MTIFPETAAVLDARRSQQFLLKRKGSRLYSPGWSGSLCKLGWQRTQIASFLGLQSTGFESDDVPSVSH